MNNEKKSNIYFKRLHGLHTVKLDAALPVNFVLFFSSPILTS